MCRSDVEEPYCERNHLLTELRALWESEQEKANETAAQKRRQEKDIATAKEMRQASLQTFAESRKRNKGKSDHVISPTMRSVSVTTASILPLMY